jgi:L-ascorbate metabolism protein UlaG (beta-lactamase superfamily)
MPSSRLSTGRFVLFNGVNCFKLQVSLMQPAFAADEVFLMDVREVLRAGKRAVWWLGQSGFLVVQDGRGLVFDPYLSESLTRKYEKTDKPHTRMTRRVVSPEALGKTGIIDVVTSSHNHTDHLDAETLLPLLAGNPQARLIVPEANRGFVLERLGGQAAPMLVGLDDGKAERIKGLEVVGVAAAHPTVERDEAGRCRFLGYVVRWGDRTIYHSGDTLLHDKLAPTLRGFRVDVALLPINGDRPERRVAGNLDGVAAARLARDIGAGCVIPCHYDMFEFNTASPEEFTRECNRIGQRCRVLRNGERLDL